TPLFFKFVMTAFDIGVMVLLMLMIRRQGVSPSRLLFYAANPLVIVYISGEGHLDVVQVFFLFLALYLILYQKSPFSGFLLLGVAVLTKYFAFVAWPFLVNAENRWKSLAVFIPLVLYMPFLDAGLGIFQSLGTFAGNFHYNDSIAVLLRSFFGDRHLFAGAFFLFVCLAWVYLFVHEKLRSVYLAVGCLMIFLPTLHPWYLVLIAPFLVFFPSLAWLYLLAAVVFTFPVIAIESRTGIFQEIFWLKFFEYVPFCGLLIWGIFRCGYIIRDRMYPKPKNISVIVPVLNEEYTIGRCLESLKNRTVLKEIIVADGGSTDNTRSIAAKLNVRVVKSPQGRGPQIREGIKAASGDVILILHADCVAGKGVFKRIIELLKANPHVVGGAFGMQFESHHPKMRLIAFLNNIRAYLTGISFGDQAQFFRAEALDGMGGFPSMMLMEDVELSLRLKEFGRLVFLRDGIVVSGRRWNAPRFAGNFLTVFYLFTRYLIERRWAKVDRSMKKYYEIYYNLNE
ncbi:MAG: TIGR04283 family arsenosugar biosynthesis glycosyltransferase, partial [Desulfobacterales bacterium]